MLTYAISPSLVSNATIPLKKHIQNNTDITTTWLCIIFETTYTTIINSLHTSSRLQIHVLFKYIQLLWGFHAPIAQEIESRIKLIKKTSSNGKGKKIRSITVWCLRQLHDMCKKKQVVWTWKMQFFIRLGYQQWSKHCTTSTFKYYDSNAF